MLGDIGPHKGSTVLRGLVEHLENSNVEMSFEIWGSLQQVGEALASPLLTIAGPYQDNSVDDALKLANFDGFFFPYHWPETYSYTLSIAIRAGKPIAAFDLGAFEWRTAGRKNVLLLPFETAFQPAILCGELSSFFSHKTYPG